MKLTLAMLEHMIAEELDEIIHESDLEEISDGSEFVRIKKTALERLLSMKEDQEPSNIKSHCNKRGYKNLRQWLRVTNALEKANKGKLDSNKS